MSAPVKMAANFAAGPAGRPADARLAFGEPAFTRLGQVKAAWDPANRFRFNVNVPPAPSSVPAAPATRAPACLSCSNAG